MMILFQSLRLVLTCKATLTSLGWMDAYYGFERTVPYEIYYTKLRLQGAGEWDEFQDCRHMQSRESMTLRSPRLKDGNKCLKAAAKTPAYPALLTDPQNNIHIAWLDFGNASAGEEILYTRLVATENTGPGETALDPWNSTAVTSWSSFRAWTEPVV